MVAMGTVDKKLTFRKRKGFNDVKKYIKTVNPNLPDQVTQKGYFKDGIEEWKEGGYSTEDIEAWNLYSRANRLLASGFNMFMRFKIIAAVANNIWSRLTNCIIYDVVGSGFKVDVNVGGDYSGKLYFGKSKIYMVNEVSGVFSVDKYTFNVTGLSVLTKYYFYIKNTSVGQEGRTGIYSKKTTEFTPVVIDIGNPAIYRDFAFAWNYTIIDLENPANESGKIKSVELWAKTNLLQCEVATFFHVAGNNYSTRDHQYIGSVTAGAKRTFVVDINVQVGDFIGIYYDTGTIARDYVGGIGLMYAAGDRIPCTNLTFYLKEDDRMSVYGIGVQ